MIEAVLHTIFEVIFSFLAYWTGFIFLNFISLGSIRLGGLDSLGQENKRKTGKLPIDWSIWLRRSHKPRVLKAEFVMLIGFLVWVAMGFTLYFTTQ